MQNIDCVEAALHFRVEAGDFFGTGATVLRGQGYLAQRSYWRLISDTDTDNDIGDLPQPGTHRLPCGDGPL